MFERFTIIGIDGVSRTYDDRGKRYFGVQTEVTTVIELKPETPMVQHVMRQNREERRRETR